MPNAGPSQQCIGPVLEALRERGALGATSRELMLLTGRYQDALAKLRDQGYQISSENAHLPPPYSSVKRYTLVEQH